MKILDRLNFKEKKKESTSSIDPNSYQERRGKMINKIYKNEDLKAQLRKLERMKLEKRMMAASHDLKTRALMGSVKTSISTDVTG